MQARVIVRCHVHACACQYADPRALRYTTQSNCPVQNSEATSNYKFFTLCMGTWSMW